MTGDLYSIDSHSQWQHSDKPMNVTPVCKLVQFPAQQQVRSVDKLGMHSELILCVRVRTMCTMVYGECVLCGGNMSVCIYIRICVVLKCEFMAFAHQCSYKRKWVRDAP